MKQILRKDGFENVNISQIDAIKKFNDANYHYIQFNLHNGDGIVWQYENRYERDHTKYIIEQELYWDLD